MLGDTGAVGGALLAGFLVALAAAGFLTSRRLSPGERTLSVACAAVTVHFLVQASVDWVDKLPAVAAPALALPFVALGLGRREPARASSFHLARSWAAPLRRTLAAVIALAAVASFSLPWLAARYVERTRTYPVADARDADRDLDRAERLNPLSVEPRLTRGTLALQRRDYRGARAAFEEANRHESSWYAYFELALIDAREGRFEAARVHLTQTTTLNRADPFVAEAARRISRRERIEPSVFNAEVVRETRRRFTRTGS